MSLKLIFQFKLWCVMSKQDKDGYVSQVCPRNTGMSYDFMVILNHVIFK